MPINNTKKIWNELTGDASPSTIAISLLASPGLGYWMANDLLVPFSATHLLGYVWPFTTIGLFLVLLPMLAFVRGEDGIE